MVETLLEDRYRDASEETRRQIDVLLAQDADDRAWAEQLGPVYRQRHVAELLRRSRQGVSADVHLLRLEMRDATIGYPVFQFDGRRVLPGVREVVKALDGAVATSWTTASWLTTAQRELDGRRPLDLLRDRQVDVVLDAARRLATALSR